LILLVNGRVMGQWTKYYADGTSYTATDDAVGKGVASWRNSRQLGMIKAELIHDKARLEIIGLGEYWQSDTYNCVFPGSKTQLTKRRIEKLVDITDMFYFIEQDDKGLKIVFNTQCENFGSKAVPQDWKGKWIVAELDIRAKKYSYYVRGDRR